MTTTDQPDQVNLWQATNPEARDFRVDTIGAAYSSTPLLPERKGLYVGRVAAPTKGYTAFFVELTFGSGLKFTTEVSVLPDRLPYRFADAAKKYAATAP